MIITSALKAFQKVPDMYEQVVGDLIREFPRGGVMVDGGAHVGLHTAVMLARTDVRRVYAAEAIPQLCERLEKRFSGHNALHLLRCAIGREVGRASFSVAVGAQGYSGLRQRDVPAVTQWQKIDVEVTTLDYSVDPGDVSDVALIKLDLEGAEFDALRGGRELLRRARPLVVFENGLRNSAAAYGYSWENFSAFFFDLGYEVTDFFGNRVDRSYWEDVLRTYMFIAAPADTATARWVDVWMAESVNRHANIAG